MVTQKFKWISRLQEQTNCSCCLWFSGTGNIDSTFLNSIVIKDDTWLIKQSRSFYETCIHAIIKNSFSVVILRRKDTTLMTRFEILIFFCSFKYVLYASIIKSVIIKEERHSIYFLTDRRVIDIYYLRSLEQSTLK